MHARAQTHMTAQRTGDGRDSGNEADEVRGRVEKQKKEEEIFFSGVSVVARRMSLEVESMMSLEVESKMSLEVE